MMGALVAVEAVTLVLFGVLLVGLLKSHAEILRQLHGLGAGRQEEPQRRVSTDPVAGGATGTPAHDLVGQTPGGEAAAVAVVGTAQDTLLAFLSSGCLTCAGFWKALGAGGHLGLPEGMRVVAVTKGRRDESESSVRSLAPAGRTVVMSTQAWLDYEVPGSPYFVLVSASSGRVIGEGTAATWEQVVSLVSRAGNDGLAVRTDTRLQMDEARGPRIDQELMAAGFLPGDPRLYPMSRPGPGDQR
ncbi:MAG: hypothetical protein H0U41_08965 [Actinobacteria bacterium]|nr:hypothetical protein [Actinomycetota bacterium]